MRLKAIRSVIRFLLRMLTRIEVRGRENIPESDHFIITANHLGLVDAFLPFYIIDNNNLLLLVGEKWQKMGIMRWLGKRLNFLFVDRFNPDLRAIREVMTRMKQGEVLVITPEGTRSKVGHLIAGKPGVSYLATKLGYPILPVAISGTFDPLFFGQLKRLKRPRVVVSIGPAFLLPPLPHQGRDEALQRYTDDIMCRIALMMPEDLRGVYASHPRLKQIMEETAQG